MAANVLISDPIAQLLEHQILPFVISAERLWRRPEYLIYTFYSYTREVLGAFAGLGLAGPVVMWAQLLKDGKVADGHASTAVPTGISLGIVALIIVLRVVFSKRDLEKRSVLAETCRKEFQSLNTRIIASLARQDVGGELAKMRNEAADIYRRHSGDGSYPWAIAEPGIEPIVRQRLQYMLKQIVQPLGAPESIEVPRGQRMAVGH